VYNLIVSHKFADGADGTYAFSKERFLESTNNSIAAQLRSLSVEAVECLRSWPCIFMEEGRGEERAFIGRLAAIQNGDSDLSLTIVVCSHQTTILNDDIWRARAELDIEQFEFSRYHWAIKDRDLFHVLGSVGRRFEPSVTALFVNRPLPAPSPLVPTMLRHRPYLQLLSWGGELVENGSHGNVHWFATGQRYASRQS